MSNAERRITRDEHETALDVARWVTSPPRPPRTTRLNLFGRIAGAGVEKEQIDDIVRNLTKTDYLWKYDYSLRPEAVPDDQHARVWYTINEDPWLADWVRLEAQTDEPDTELIAALNKQRQNLREDSDAT